MPRDCQPDTGRCSFGPGRQWVPRARALALSIRARPRGPLADPFELGRLSGALQHVAPGDAGPQDLAGRRLIAELVDVPLADLERTQPQAVCEAVHLGLARELHLGRAKASKGAVRRRIGPGGPSPDPDVRAAIRTTCVDRTPAED